MATKKPVTEVSEESEISLRPYELMCAFNPVLLESELKKKFKEVEEMVEKSGGKIVQTDVWGKRKMAYPIKLQKEGSYIVWGLELKPESLKEFDEHFRIDKDVLRHLMMALPKGYVYVKFSEEADAPARPAPRSEKPERHVAPKAHTTSASHSTTDHSAKKAVEEAPAKPEEAKSISKAELDEQLNKIIGGTDLNI